MTHIDADWLKSDSTQKVLKLLTDAGFRAYAVGGCVRNTILEIAISDIDIATDALPEVVMELVTTSGLRVIPTGIDHGTVTVLADAKPYEVTTFRRDVGTDGRRATVSFSDRIEDDARRRDFTMNALYADGEGQVVDPLGGLQDLLDRRVRFIENARERIREDYLRSLRYFRFHAYYGDPSSGFDAEALDAIAAEIDGLQQLSRERVGAEMMKLLGAPDPAPSVAAMRTTGALQAVLPGSDDSSLAAVIHLEETLGVEPDPVRRLAVIGGEDIEERLRLSRKDMTRLALLKASIGQFLPRALGYRLGFEIARDVLILEAAIGEHEVDTSKLTSARSAASEVFPLNAADLMPRYTGAALGKVLAQLEVTWIESGFSLTRDQLLAGLGED